MLWLACSEKNYFYYAHTGPVEHKYKHSGSECGPKVLQWRGFAHPSTSARSPSSSADSETNISGAPVEHNRKLFHLRIIYLHWMTALPPIRTEWNLLCMFISKHCYLSLNYAIMIVVMLCAQQAGFGIADVVLLIIKLCKHTLIYTSQCVIVCSIQSNSMITLHTLYNGHAC